MDISTIGLDLAKNVFQVHGVDAAGGVVVRRTLRRKDVLPFFCNLEPCLIGMEACGSAHHWARELRMFGHEVKLMPPVYVKPYVKRNKNDMADAEAICEAVSRPSMRFVPVKSIEQQSVLMLHRVRALMVRQRTMSANAIRAHLAELGIIVAQGVAKLLEITDRLFADESLPELVRWALAPLIVSLRELSVRIKELETQIMRWHRANEMSRRLETIPGFGFVTATAMAASVPDAKLFKSGREFAAWLGLTPRQNSSGGKERLGSITKMGNSHLRTLLVNGATSVLRFTKKEGSALIAWMRQLRAKKPPKVVAVALANKMARIAWAVMTREESYRVAPV